MVVEEEEDEVVGRSVSDVFDAANAIEIELH